MHTDTRHPMSLLTKQSFIVVDLETTGFGPPEHAITEIAALRIWQGQITDRYVSLVNPGRPIPPQIERYTGISNAMVAEAPGIETVMPEFWIFAGPAPIVAHNSKFDRSFLDHAARGTLGHGLDNPDLCTVRLARKLLPQLPSRSLGPLAEHLGVPIHARHRAMGDAEATAKIFLLFLHRLQEAGVTDLESLLTYQSGATRRRKMLR